MTLSEDLRRQCIGAAILHNSALKLPRMKALLVSRCFGYRRCWDDPWDFIIKHRDFSGEKEILFSTPWNSVNREYI